MSTPTLTTNNNSAIDTPTSEFSIGWAILKQDPVRRVPKREVFSAVLMSVAKAFADMNTKSITAQDRDYMVNELTDNIIARYPAIRISEIPVAIAHGVRGRYGEFFGLSVIAFERFIEQYLLSEDRARAVKEIRRDDQGRRIPSPEEQFTTAKSNVMMVLGRKKSGQSSGNMAVAAYDFLDKLGLLQFSRDEKYDMMADATRELVSELKYKLYTTRGIDRNSLKRDIGAYTAALTGGPLTDAQKQNVVRISKRLALDAFLQQVLLEELDLEAMIEAGKEKFAVTNGQLADLEEVRSLMTEVVRKFAVGC